MIKKWVICIEDSILKIINKNNKIFSILQLLKLIKMYSIKKSNIKKNIYDFDKEYKDFS